MKPYLLLSFVYAFAPWFVGQPAKAAEPDPAPVVHRDLPYAATNDPLQTLDVYTPADAKAKNRPIVFWIHGGGWTGGDKRDVAHKPAAFVAKNYLFVSINYRLFPNVSLKTIAADVARAIRWTHYHAAEFGGDGSSIFVMGHSAGAQLAALVCTDERYLAAEGLPLSIIKGCVPVDGDTYDVPMQIAAEIPKNKELHRAKFGDEKSQRDLSPVTYVTSGKSIPPFLFLFVADHPETSVQARRLAQALQQSGINAQTFGAENTDHKKLNNSLGAPGDKPTVAIFEFLDQRSSEHSSARGAQQPTDGRSRSTQASPASRSAVSVDDQIHSLLFDRRDEAGNSFPNMIDPPLWSDTHYLLEGDSNAQFNRVLDVLLSQDLKQTMPDHRRRALLQHELWNVFDWTLEEDSFDQAARAVLRKKLAAAISALELTNAEMESLPQCLPPAEISDLVNDLAAGHGKWVNIGATYSMVAEAHARDFGGRSVFNIYLQHPGGAAAVRRFRKALHDAPYPVGAPPDAANSLPKLPAGTKLALVRRMMLIDRDGEPVCSPIIQSIQVRTLIKVEPPEIVRSQEFRLDRRRYLDGERESLRSVVAGEYEPSTFRSVEVDPFERISSRGRNSDRSPETILNSCIACHHAPGVMSMNSYTRFMSPGPIGNPELVTDEAERQAFLTIDWKQRQASWGMLRGLWEAADKR